ncbi:MAG TPA: ATP-binding protein [Burkholderiaceae bacterium]
MDSDISHGRIGMSVGDEWMRVEADEATSIEPGCSGGPVWSTELGAAVAMVVARRGARTAYGVSLDRLARRSPLLAAAMAGAPGPSGWLAHVPAGLQGDFIPFARVIDDRTTDFVGRALIFAAIDERLTKAPCGYVFIRGEPGIGKSALMAQLARTRGWVHHFNIGPENLRSPERFLRNTCAQLVLRYRLPLDQLPRHAGVDARFIVELFVQAVARAPGEPVVLLVDALDEAEEPPDRVNRLFLPATLPQGVFVIATIRSHVDEKIDTAQRCDDIELREDGAENRADVLTYIRAFLQRNAHRMTQRLAAWDMTEDAFTELLAQRSEGNFMYLRHVLADLAAGPVRPGERPVAELPKGLVNYYARHWRRMQAIDAGLFRRLHKPVLAFLAIAREPVSAEAVAGWMNDSEEFDAVDAGEIEDLFDEWREFLQEDPGPPVRCRLYHNSFLDFLDHELKLQRYRRIQARVMRERVGGDDV